MHKLKVETAQFCGAIIQEGAREPELNWFFDIDCEGFNLGADAYDIDFEDYIRPKVPIEWLQLDVRDWRDLGGDLSLTIGDRYRASTYVSNCHNFFPRLRLKFSRRKHATFEVQADFDVDFETEGSGYRSTSGSLRRDFHRHPSGQPYYRSPRR
jgi:hypothetical protein